MWLMTIIETHQALAFHTLSVPLSEYHCHFIHMEGSQFSDNYRGPCIRIFRGSWQARSCLYASTQLNPHYFDPNFFFRKKGK